MSSRSKYRLTCLLTVLIVVSLAVLPTLADECLKTKAATALKGINRTNDSITDISLTSS